MFYVISKSILAQDKHIIDIRFDTLYITNHLVYFGLEDISQSTHAHREAIVSEFPKFGNNHRHVLDIWGNPYSVVSHVYI